MRHRRWLVFLAVCTLLALGLAPVAAQSRLFDGASIVGRIALDTPAADYSFDASRGDAIALRVLGLNGLDPVMTVRGQDGADFLTGFDDPWSPEPGDSVLTFNAPDGGAYTVHIEGEGGSAGDFVLQFDQSPPSPAAVLPGGQAVPLPITAAAGPTRLQFAANPDCPTVLIVTPDGTAGFNALVNLTDEAGTQIAQLGAGPSEKRLTLAANSGLYTAEIVPLPGSTDGQMVLTVACAAEQPACTAVPAPADTPAVAATPGPLLMTQPGGDLDAGQSRQGEIGQSSPLIGYTFEGSAGDEIAVQVTGISFDFNPSVSLLGPTLTTLASAEDSPGSFRPGDAVLRAVLPEDGGYTALVGSTGGLPGTFLIRLAEDPASASVALSPDAPADVDAAALAGDDGWFQRYTFSALDSCPTALDIQTAESIPLAVGLVVRSAGGTPIGQIYPSAVTGAHLVVPAGSGAYEVLIPRIGNVEELGTLNLRVSCQSDSPACTAGGPLLISTPTPGEPPFAPSATPADSTNSGVTGVVSSTSANVRRGDSQDFSVIRALLQGTEVEVIGVSNSGSGWFKVRLDDGAEGWMAPFTLTVTGDTGSLPRLQPPAPVAAPTASTGGGGSPGDVSDVVCGNGWCEGDESGTCCSDCGTCAAVCGNGACESGETCSTCAADCGSANPEDACANYCLCNDGSSASVSDCSICESDVCLTGNVAFCSQPLAR